MSFVALGGDDAVRPTFFELVAAERLVPSLKAALVYALSVYAQRRPVFHGMLDYEDELFALATLLLDRQSLWTRDATFAESLYSLKRVHHRPARDTTPAASSSSNSSSTGGTNGQPKAKRLTSRQKWATLLVVVGLPYARSKLQALYSRHHQPRTNHHLLGFDAAFGDQFPQHTAPQQQQQQPGGEQHAGARGGGRLARLRAACLRMFVRAYPWVHAGTEGLVFVYQLAYLLEYSQHYSPALAILRQKVARVSGREVAEQQRELGAARARAVQRARAARGGALRGALVQAQHFVADHTRTALIVGVFGFKLLEWWFTSAEEQLAAQRALKPPPPPPAPRPHPHGVPLPLDPAACPLCGCQRTNPAQVIVSGYVFCYPCIYRYITEHGSCPVTCMPARLDHVRRVYQAG